MILELLICIFNMKKIVIIVIFISTQLFAEVIKIETGELAIKNKLLRIGAENVKLDNNYTVWTLTSSDITVDFLVYKYQGNIGGQGPEWLAKISVWSNIDSARRLPWSFKDAEYRKVRSISFDTDKKSIQVTKFHGTICIRIGDTDVTEKLKQVGARDLWNVISFYDTDMRRPGLGYWGLSGSNSVSTDIHVEVVAPEGRVSAISFWTAPYTNKSEIIKNRCAAQSLKYNAESKMLQVDCKPDEGKRLRQADGNRRTPETEEHPENRRTPEAEYY
jgi:hypothetical protein